ncbi:MAG TPA: NUDIX hydrolase [Gemmatimonadales bacterium]|nr:NUDIX hydrolase [Gemmatimonadales bacterium]
MEAESSRRVFDGKLIKVDVERWPSGEREVMKHPGACAVVAITAEGEVLLVKQFREAVRQELLEIPAGIIEEGESAEECAARELLEETGYRATKLQHLGSIYTSPGFTNERIELFRAEPERVGDPTEEAVDVVTIPIIRAIEAADRGDIVDLKTLAALLLVRG